jgi:beta-D-xylosidase 4
LLKNVGGFLPLDNRTIQSLASVGPTKDCQDCQGDYGGRAPFLIGMTDGLKRWIANVNEASGCSIAGSDSSGIAQAVTAAVSSNVTFIFIGIDGSQEGETHDRDFVHLPGLQDQLVVSVASAATASGGNAVVVVLGGGAVDLSAIKQNSNVSAIIWAGYPGEHGGTALGEIIFGATNPSGRLTQTFYDTQWADSCSMLTMNVRPSKDCPPGRSHRFLTSAPVYKFGAGLSYSRWVHQLQIDRGMASRGDMLADLEAFQHRPHLAPKVVRVTVTVTNGGALEGEWPVLLFARPPVAVAGVARAPLQVLAAFERTPRLCPGQQWPLTFPLSAHHLSYANIEGQRDVAMGSWQIFVEGQAEGAADVSIDFLVTS